MQASEYDGFSLSFKKKDRKIRKYKDKERKRILEKRTSGGEKYTCVCMDRNNKE